MKNKHSLLIYPITAFIIWNLASCKTKEPVPEAVMPATGTVELIFTPMQGSNVLKIGEEGLTPKGEKITIKNFKYFVSNIAFAKLDNSEVAAQPIVGDSSQVGVYLVDFNTPNADAGSGQYSYKIKFKAQVGEYVDIRYDLAVPRNYNYGDITLNPHPMRVAQGNMYWSWNSGFKFLVLEGSTPLSTGAWPYANGFHLSIGLQNRTMPYNFRSLILASSRDKMVVQKDKTTQLFFTYDVNALFANTDGSLYSFAPVQNGPDPTQVHGGILSDDLKANSVGAIELIKFTQPQ